MNTEVEEEQLVQKGHKHVLVTPVSASRHAHTCVTTTWASGEPGPLIYVFPESQFPHERLIALNQYFKNEIWCVTSGKDTHFMDGEVTIRMWEECFANTFAQRRERFNLSLLAQAFAILERSERLFQKHSTSSNVNYTNALLFRLSAVLMTVCLYMHVFSPSKDKGALVFDGFTGNSSCVNAGLETRRKIFTDTNNIVTFQFVAKSTADMQPCDAIHAYWRRLTDVYEQVSCGFSNDITLRPRLEY